MLYVQTMVCRKNRTIWYVPLVPGGTVHPQELLFRCCMCRLWYVVRTALSGTSRWYQRERSETCRADTCASINNQCCNIVYLVGMYIYCKKLYTDLPMSSSQILCFATVCVYFIANPVAPAVLCSGTSKGLTIINLMPRGIGLLEGTT